MVFALGIAGCSNKQTVKPAETNTKEGPNPEDVGYPEKLTYWVELNPNVSVTSKSLNDVGVYQEIEKATGTKVEFKHPSGEGDQVTEQFNLMIASGNLPDVIEYSWLTVPKGPDNAIKNGTIIRLNELIEKYAPNFSKYLDEHPDIKKMIMTDDGNIYSFPFIRGDESLKIFMGPLLRNDWLKKLQLDIPSTISEFEEVLTAIKEGDPNGNGKQDEIPLLLELADIKGTGAFASAWGISPWFYNDNGTVKFGSIQPEFGEFLTTMNSWYEKGLLDPDFAAMDSKLRDAKMTGNQLAGLYSYTGSGIGKYTGLMKEKYPDFELFPAPHPGLKEGQKAAMGQKDNSIPGNAMAAITTSAENPEEIVKWLDFAYSEEGHMLFNFGIEGVSYEMKDGYPAYTAEITKNPDGLPFTQAAGKYIRASYNGPFVQDKRYIEQYAELPEQKEAIKIWDESAENKINMPPITMTAEENEEYASIMSDLETYYDEMVIKFIMGDTSMDKFEEFVETLKGMGIERAIELQQNALDRYNKR
ncbi:ABC transporter substrate-binding protein [Bacillus sp. SA1-12]|nr:extracellular solute-binding protein [Bacillus sp. SA1-12]KKI89477.1 ABC transporter substrate-binding protein [Bacillus sp. SA1-12]